MTDVSNSNARTLAGYEQQRFELKMKHVQNNEIGCTNEKVSSQRIQTKSARETTFSPSTTNVRQTKGTNSNSNFTNVIPQSLNNDNKFSNNSFVNAKKYSTPHNNEKEIARETRNLKQKRDRRKTLNSTLLNNLISATVKKAERLSHSARRNSGIGLDYIRQLSSKNTNLPNLSTNFTPDRKASNFSRHLSTAQFSTKEAYANDLDLGFNSLKIDSNNKNGSKNNSTYKEGNANDMRGGSMMNLSAIQNPNDSSSKDTIRNITKNNQSNKKTNTKSHILRKTSCAANVGIAHALIPTVNAEDSIKLTERLSNSGKNGYKKLTQSFRRKSLSGNSSMSNSSGISVSGSVSTNSGGLKPNRISGASINSHSSRGSNSDKSDFAMGPSCENLSTCPALLNPIMPALGSSAIIPNKHKTKLSSSKSVSQDHPRKLPSISSMLAIQNIHPDRLIKPNIHNCHQPRISLDSRFKNASHQSKSYGLNEELSPASARKSLFRERSVSLSNKKMAGKLASLAKLGEDSDSYSNHSRDIGISNNNNTTAQLSLEQVIEQKPHRNKFYNFLCSEHSEESLEFILSVRKLNKSQENHSKRSNQATMIYETHIRQGSEKEINILYKTRKNIEDAMVKTDGLVDFQDILIALDKAKDEIYALLRRDSWPRFLAACS